MNFVATMKADVHSRIISAFEKPSRTFRLVLFYAGYCRAKLALMAVRHLAALFQGHWLSHYILQLFDPNYIRKFTQVKFSAKYLDATGVFGENYRANVNDHIGYHLFVRGYYDLTPAVLGVLFGKAWGGVFIDIGANVGSTSIPVAKAGIETFGIEASARVIHDLSYNVWKNSPIPYSILNLAITSPEKSSNQSRTTLHLVSGNFGATSLYKNWNLSNDSTPHETASLKTIESVVRWLELKNTALIKIDVEGHEYEVLQGASETLSALRPAVVFEWRPDVMSNSGVDIRDIRPLFPAHYKFYAVGSTYENGWISLELANFLIDTAYENVLALSQSRIAGASTIEDFITRGKIRIAI